MRWPSPDQRARAVALVVGLHFLLSVLAVAPCDGLRRTPGPAQAIALYERAHLDQRWEMFAPPPRVRSRLGYALRVPAGWTEVRRVFGERLPAVPDAFFVPHGVDRLRSFVSVLGADFDLASSPGRQRYFDGIVAVLCRERPQGTRPGVARIYLLQDGGSPERTVHVAIYEGDCEP